jgi:tRNA G46 methylase TrmB
MLAIYERVYPGKELHFAPETLPPLSAETLFGAERTGETLVFDLGCGRGEFIVGQAVERPDKLFVGIDYHQKSIWDGINRAIRAGADNVRFVRADLRRVLHKAPDESVHEAYMLFPPTASISRKRNSDPFPVETLEQLHRVLVVGAPFHLVSDHEGYFGWKRGMIERAGLFDVAVFSKAARRGSSASGSDSRSSRCAWNATRNRITAAARRTQSKTNRRYECSRILGETLAGWNGPSSAAR